LRVVAGGKGARHIARLARPRAGQRRHHDAMAKIERAEPVWLEQRVRVCALARGRVAVAISFIFSLLKEPKSTSLWEILATERLASIDRRQCKERLELR
jgi:hypothetical protein